MTVTQSFPGVPDKQRIASKLTVVSYLAKGEANKDLKIDSIIIASGGIATVKALAIAGTEGNFTTDAIVFLYGTGLPEIEGLNKVLADATHDGANVVFTVQTAVVAGLAVWSPSEAGAILYSDFVPTSQITDWTTNVTGATDSWSTLGTEALEEAGETSRPVTLSVYLRKGMDQLGPLLGCADPIVDVVDLKPDTKVHLLISNWEGRLATSKMQNFTFCDSVAWSDWKQGQSAGDYVQWDLSGAATAVWSKAVVQA